MKKKQYSWTYQFPDGHFCYWACYTRAQAISASGTSAESRGGKLVRVKFVKLRKKKG